MFPESEHIHDHAPHHTLPQVDPLPVPNALSNPLIDSSDRPAAIREIVKQIHAIPTGDYETTRNKEMDRLQVYYDIFARLWGVDLRAVATTRMQLMRAVNGSIPLFAETPIGDEKPGEKVDGMPFFERGKRTIDDLTLSATYRPRIAGHRMAYSVLKVPQEDEFGTWELDYPLISLEPGVLQKLLEWQKAQGQSDNLNDNPILTIGAQLISRRIHDWFHAAVLYNTQSRTEVFQNWSDDSFFVKHLFDEKGMINYEFLANWTHYTIWQQIFKDDPESKKKVLQEANTYLHSLDQFQAWLDENGHEGSQNMTDFLAFLGMRSLFDIMPIEDEDLQALPRYGRCMELLEDKERRFISRLSSFDQHLPFDRNSSKQLTVQEIIDRYLVALVEEERTYRLEGQYQRLISDVPDQDHNDSTLNLEITRLPQPILQQMTELPLNTFDPSAIRHLRRGLDQLEETYGTEHAQTLIEKVHVSEDGYVYLDIDPGDVDMSIGSEVIHSKRALLIQIPHDFEPFELELKRKTTLLKESSGAKYMVKPGDVIIVNIQDPFFAQDLLDQATVDGEIDIQLLLDLIKKKGKSGMSDTLDSYPYPLHKADMTFGLSGKGAVRDVDGRKVLQTGMYQTAGRVRRAMRIDGPVAVHSSNGSVMKVPGGALVEDTHGGSDSDVFPVIGNKFHTNYSGARLESLQHVQLQSGENRLPQEGVLELLRILDMTNKIQLYGILPSGTSAPATVGEFIAATDSHS